MNNMAFELYKTKKGMVNREKYYELLEETLHDFPFASLKQINVSMKCDPRFTEGLVLDYIIKYSKENPGLNGVQIAKDLLVGTEFVEKLIEQGVLIEASPAEVEKLKQAQEKSRELNQRILDKPEERNDLALANQLRQSISVQTEAKLELKPKGPTFHTQMHRSFDGKYIKK